MTSLRTAFHTTALPPLPACSVCIIISTSFTGNLWHGGVLSPQPLMVEQQGAIPVKKVEVVHHHLNPIKIWKDVIFREGFHIVTRLQRKLEKALLERVLHRTLLDPLIVCPPKRVKVNLNSILSFWTSVYNHSHQFWSTRRFSHRWFCKVWIEIDLKYSPQTKRFSSSEGWSTYRESPSLPLWRVSFRELGVLQSFLTTQLNLNDKKMFH